MINSDQRLLEEAYVKVLEGVPVSGKSSGKAITFKNPPIEKKNLTLEEILKEISGIPYYQEVLEDVRKKDLSWDVTSKVLEYAQYLLKNPSSIKQLPPPLIVLDGKLQDGAHRISALYLLQNLLDPNNSYWKSTTLKVHFGKSSDVNK
jgi:hypothetical protein